MYGADEFHAADQIRMNDKTPDTATTAATEKHKNV
jgi:hypothetical protein